MTNEALQNLINSWIPELEFTEEGSQFLNITVKPEHLHQLLQQLKNNTFFGGEIDDEVIDFESFHADFPFRWDVMVKVLPSKNYVIYNNREYMKPQTMRVDKEELIVVSSLNKMSRPLVTVVEPDSPPVE